MSTLSSASTDAQVQAEYEDCASYAEDGDTSKARRFVTAIRILLLRFENMASSGGKSVQYDRSLLQKELERAERWVAGRPATSGQATGGKKYFDMSGYRD